MSQGKRHRNIWRSREKRYILKLLKNTIKQMKIKVFIKTGHSPVSNPMLTVIERSLITMHRPYIERNVLANTITAKRLLGRHHHIFQHHCLVEVSQTHSASKSDRCKLGRRGAILHGLRIWRMGLNAVWGLSASRPPRSACWRQKSSR